MEDKLLFIGILAVVIWLYVSQRFPIIIIAVLTIIALTSTGLLPVSDAFIGLANPATISIGCMFVLSAGLIKTGALEPVVAKMAYWSKGSYSRLMLLTALFVPFVSAFINNTPVVVMMVPVFMGLCRRFEIAPSKLMIPLSYFSIIGGTCTLIGTSTNLLVADIYHQHAGDDATLSLFDFTPLGIILLVVGVPFIMLYGRRYLPDRESLTSLLPVSRRSNYVTEVIVPKDSSIIGSTVHQVFFKGKSSLRFLQLLRGNAFFIGIEAHELVLQKGDVLILEGSPEELTSMLYDHRVRLGTALEDAERVPVRTFSLTMFELVILPGSTFIGGRVDQLTLNAQFGLKVLAVQRGGRHHRKALRKMYVRAGDMLLVQGDQKAISRLKETPDLLVIEDLEARMRNQHKASTALAVMAGVVLMTSLTDIPLMIWALIGVVVMVQARCLRTEEAIASLDFNVMFLLVGTIPLGIALERTGLHNDINTALIAVIGSDHPVLMVSAVYLVTNILTSLLSNTAVAVLMTPIAFNLAIQMGVDPKPFIMTVAFAASAAFATPVSYQTNVIVMGPGGYRFSDFIKIGAPLGILLWLTASLLIPVFYPL